MQAQNLVLLTGGAHGDGASRPLISINGQEKVPVGMEGAGQQGWGSVSVAVVIDAQAFWE